MSYGRVVQDLMGYALYKYVPYSNYPPAMANSLTRLCMSNDFALYVIRNLRPIFIDLPVQLVTNGVQYQSLAFKIFCKQVI